jgi:putative molybdenum carrier protein
MARKRLVAPINWKLEQVISGGQIGADIAGVRAAKAAGILTGGYMPVGWITYEGLRPEYEEEFGMKQCLLGSYKTRTWENVKHSDGTMRFAYRWFSPGERCTKNALEAYGKPSMDIPPANPPKPRVAALWLRDRGIRVLNVAGNADYHLEAFVEEYLTEVFKWLRTS